MVRKQLMRLSRGKIIWKSSDELSRKETQWRKRKKFSGTSEIRLWHVKFCIK